MVEIAGLTTSVSAKSISYLPLWYGIESALYSCRGHETFCCGMFVVFRPPILNISDLE